MPTTNTHKKRWLAPLGKYKQKQSKARTENEKRIQETNTSSPIQRRNGWHQMNGFDFREKKSFYSFFFGVLCRLRVKKKAFRYHDAFHKSYSISPRSRAVVGCWKKAEKGSTKFVGCVLSRLLVSWWQLWIKKQKLTFSKRERESII